MKALIIGLTGPSGAGKGVVAELLRQRGVGYVDCDLLARQIVQPGEPALDELAAAFSHDIIRPDGTLDRAKLAELAFASSEGTATLNAITHPHIMARLRDNIAEKSREHSVVLVDAPTLFESGAAALCDRIVAVIADKQTRLERIMARDCLDENAALRRINAQPSDDFYTECSDYTLVNGGDLAALTEQVNKMHHKLISERKNDHV